MESAFFPFFLFLGYFAPSLVALFGKRKNVNAITLVNLFFGWTVIGWIVALIWAVKKD